MDAWTTQNWSEALNHFQQWVATQEGIQLTPTKLSVPQSLREEFYGRTRFVQELLATEMLGDELLQAENLAQHVEAARTKLCQATGLKCYVLAPRLEQFLQHPREAVARPLQSTVVDITSGALPIEQVDTAAREAIRAPFDVLVRSAYEAWAYITALLALKPVRMWAIDADDAGRTSAIQTEEVWVGWQKPSRELRIPEAVLQTEDGSTFAVKTECAREIDYYDTLEPMARDNSAGGNTHELLCHRLLLLYRLSNELAAACVVDRKKKVQTSCDLALEVLSPNEMDNPSYLGAFIQRARKLRTKRPLQILTYGDNGTFPPQMTEDPQAPTVSLHAVNLDETAVAHAVTYALATPATTPIPYPVTC